MCLNETYSTVRVGKNLSEMFPTRNGLKQEDALRLFLFNFALDYAIAKGPSVPRWLENKWYKSPFGLCLSVNKMGGSVHTIKKTETLAVARKENGLTVKADKIAWSCLDIGMQNSSFERVQVFKYF